MRIAYNDFVASLIDQGEGHWTIICKAVQANKDGIIHIPVKKMGLLLSNYYRQNLQCRNTYWIV